MRFKILPGNSGFRHWLYRSLEVAPAPMAAVHLDLAYFDWFRLVLRVNLQKNELERLGWPEKVKN